MQTQTRQNPRFKKPDGCAPCSLAEIGFGYAPPSGPPSARLQFVGEALGWEEAVHGEPFIGSAGGVLTRILTRAGINRADVRIGNVVSCRPPNDYLVGAPWEEHAISCCSQYLNRMLQAVPIDACVVTLGATALGSVLNLRGVKGVAVKEWHGTVNRDPSNRFWVVPSFHPSFLQRGTMNLLQVVTEDLRLADRISRQGFKKSLAQLVVDPTPEWYEAWVDDHLAKVTADVDGVHLALDTEFEEKTGKDESEVTSWASQSPITRVNGSNDGVVGWTVPYVGPYIRITEKLLAGLAALGGWVWLWNKYADWDHLRAHGHTLAGIMAIDGMWLWHYLQSDVFRGLGFVAPMASDFGPWKHWAEVKEHEGAYAAADGVQTWRVCMWLLRTAIKIGMWDVFLRDWHDRDIYCLRPAHEMGVPVDRPELLIFRENNQRKLTTVLARIKETTARGVLKPKLGYARRPKGKDGAEPQPPASILGKSKKGGAEAKLLYMTEGVRLVESEIEVEVNVCDGCGASDVGAKHKCPKPKVRKARTRKAAEHVRVDGDDRERTDDRQAGSDRVDGERRPVAALRVVKVLRPRFFWSLPFNPDAPAQILAYIEQQGYDAPVDKKTQRKTTNKKALENLKQQYKDDPLFQAQLDWKAIQKVDATYGVGTLALMDEHDRVHPEYAPIPSTLRDSARHPNLTNVVADKSGPQSLSAGFRRCIVARDGLPPGVTEEEYQQWQSKWAT